MVENSVQSLTVVRVCDMVGLKRNSFYTHFSGIEDLLDALSVDLFSRVGEEVRFFGTSASITDGTLEERIASIIEFSRSDPKTAIVLYRLYTYHTASHQFVQRIITAEVQARMSSGQISIEPESAPLLARMLIAGFMDVLLQIGAGAGDKIHVDVIFELLSKIGDLAKNSSLLSSMSNQMHERASRPDV
ncbi:MAG: TetR/AcrR family transcriptional regulator [Pseudomonadota bacterium]